MNAMTDTNERRCLALYSGGLDSILAIRILQGQGVEVIPLYFCTPFFGFDALRDPEAFKHDHRARHGLDIRIVDYTEDLISILKAPRHGFGRHMNPCIDCKIGMLKRARSLLETMHATFVITGEVVGQRPMSQRRSIMRAIERQSGLEGILLRPLCARKLPETLPERLGVVERNALWDISGRGRKKQIERALDYGMDEDTIPTPAGGCLLTDEQISRKVRGTFDRCSPGLPGKADLLMDIMGRKYLLDDSTVLVVARDDGENQVISTFTDPGNVFLKMVDVSGPLCVIRGKVSDENLRTAAGVCLRYGKARGVPGHAAEYGADPADMTESIEAPVLTEEYCRTLQD
ncbi:MAG: hypothetical protein BWX71_02089 [Deltaproteobacteria bacterium ADurb.Bin072]|jgi:hypothetical protein|nr:MAG: hypothetical protein BWX71_02089 [Deltaproteobacteria bacterium ADurb.Bin072]